MRAVVARADEDDVTLKAAGALIGVASRPGRRKEFRQEDAGAILGRESRTIRRPAKEAELIAELVTAVIDFLRDTESVDKFVRTNQLWLESRDPTRIDASQTEDKSRRRVSSEDKPRGRVSSNEMIDVVGGLLKSAPQDPVARAIFDRIAMTARHGTNPTLAKQWRSRFESHYNLRGRVKELGARLLTAAQARREQPLRWDSNKSHYALTSYSCFLMVHAEINIFVLRHGGLWVLGDTEVEQEICESIHRLYLYSPFDISDDGWLRLLLAHEQGGKTLSPVERAHTIPNMPGGPHVYLEWEQFLSMCNCEDDARPSEECRVHAMIQECNRYSDLTEKLLTRQFSAPDDPLAIQQE